MTAKGEIFGSLMVNKLKGCGCGKGKIQSRNGLSRTKEYRAWCGMIRRCYNKNYSLYHRYGGRGIKVCDRWRSSLQDFILDMGLAPTAEHSLDRYPNNDGMYEPANCRWALGLEQSNNRSTNLNFTINGETKTLKQWSLLYGKKYGTVWDRVINSDEDILTALTKPEDIKQQKNSLKRKVV